MCNTHLIIENGDIPGLTIMERLDAIDTKLDALITFTSEFAKALKGTMNNPMIKMMMPAEMRNGLDNLVVGSFGTSESDT